MILSAAMMLDWLGGGARQAAARVHAAVAAVLANPALRTFDGGGTLVTRQMGDAVLQHL